MSNAFWFSIPLDWCRAVFVCRLVDAKRILAAWLADAGQPTHGTILLILFKSIMSPYPGAHTCVLWLDNRWLVAVHNDQWPAQQLLTSLQLSLKQSVIETVCLGITEGVSWFLQLSLKEKMVYLPN